MTTIPATIQERIPLPLAAAPRREGGAGISFGEIMAVLKCHAVMLILLWMFFGALAVGGFFLTYFKYPTYVAEAWIGCISDRPNESQTLVQTAPLKDEHERFINSQAQLVKSPEVLNDVLKTPEVRATHWFNELDEEDRFLGLLDTLGSAPIRNTNYIRVSMGCRYKLDPAKIVQQVVLRYYNLVQSKAKDDYRDQLNEYMNQAAQQNDQIKAKLDAIREFQARLPAGATLDTPGIPYQELIVLSEQVAALELQTNELQGLSEIYSDPAGPGVSPEDRQEVENDPIVRALANQLFALEQQQEVLLQNFGPEHRQVKEGADQITVTQRQLDQRREQRLQEVLDYRRQQILTAFQNSQHQLFLAREKKAEAEAEQADLDRARAELATLYDELEFLKKQRDDTVAFISQIKGVIQDKQTIKVSIARPATDPLERSGPQVVWLPVGVLLALLLSAGLIFLVEFTNTSVRTPQDIVRHLSTAMLGTVPDVNDEEIPIERVETAVRDAPHSMIAEAFRTIRTSLQFSAPADRQRTIIITSPSPEDGKTTVASNLATSIAQGGRRVLLVDANFRRPALQQVYPTGGEKGLSNILVGDADLQATVHQTGVGNLDVLLSGPTPPNPAELLASPQVQEFLDRAVGPYDQVIIDAPPVLLATDATVLASKVDGAILVCRANESSRGAAQRACDLLLRVNAHLFGAILNAAQTRRGGYFREQMTAFYDYQSQWALEKQPKKPALPSDQQREQSADEEHNEPEE